MRVCFPANLKRRKTDLNIAVVILAAGIGKRMKSAKHKVLHELCGRPILSYVINAAKKLKPTKIITVVGHQAQSVVERLDGTVQPVFQDKQLGTGHAVTLTKPALAKFTGPILVLPGDTPLIRSSTLLKLVRLHEQKQPAATVLIAEARQPFGYGRIISDVSGAITAIVEEKDATPAQRRINMINGGVYCFNRQKLFKALQLIGAQNRQKELYLTDVIQIFNQQGERVQAVATDEQEIHGINSRSQLAEAEEIVQGEIKRRHMDNGVTFVLPETIFIGIDTVIGRDSIIYPNVYLTGKTKIGADCAIGPSVTINDAKVGSGASIQYAVVNEAVIEDETSVGPFCYIRPGSRIKKGSKAGTFVELKNSLVGENSKVPHLSYVGDAVLGRDVNVGAGSITCNYDGFRKWRTTIEDNAFLGSDTMLIAPVKIGKGAFTAAGSAICKDVPAGSLGIERAEQRNIAGWAKKHRRKAKKSS